MKKNKSPASAPLLLQQETHHLLREVVAATRAHQADVEKIVGLSAAQVRLLTAVKQHPGCTVGECAELLGLSLPTVSNLLRELAAKKWIGTVTDKADRRRLRLHVKPAGAMRIRRRIPFAGGMLNAIITSMDEPSLHALATGLRALVDEIPPGYRRRTGATSRE